MEQEIIKAVNGQLGGFPWGGRCLSVHKNQNNEWIAECKIPGHYSRECDGYGGHFYKMEDVDCPVRQFIAEPWQIGNIKGFSIHEMRNGKTN